MSLAQVSEEILIIGDINKRMLAWVKRWNTLIGTFSKEQKTRTTYVRYMKTCKNKLLVETTVYHINPFHNMHDSDILSVTLFLSGIIINKAHEITVIIKTYSFLKVTNSQVYYC